MAPSAQSSLIFFGNERLATGLGPVAAVTLRALLDAGYRIEAVVSRSAEKPGEAAPSSVEQVATAAGLPLLNPHSKEELVAMLEPIRASVGVLIAFGLIVPPAVLERFEHGIINIHPSLLPLYRGSTPIEQTILDGATTTGASLMRVAAGMDTGPVFTQRELPLRGDETKSELAKRLQSLGAEILTESLPDIMDGKIVAKNQDETQASYSQRIAKADGELDWHKPAARLEREVRAFAGWPGSRTLIRGTAVTVTEAHVDDQPPELASEPGYMVFHGQHGISVLCGDDKLLVLDRVKPAGKREMSSVEFLRGLRHP
jgi:methionyl-tRNA formyltransferase